MGRHKDNDGAQNWGPDEVHDWGVPSPKESVSQNVPRGIGSVSGASGGGIGISPLLFEPSKSTPLEQDEPEPTIPSAALWAMEDRRHSSWRPDEDEVIRCRLGSGDTTLFVIDDGRDHCMICRLVGHDDEGCVYCLLARIARECFEDLRNGEVALEDAFVAAKDISLSSVFESDSASNVVHVQHYRRVGDVPVDYLPPSPFIQFTGE